MDMADDASDAASTSSHRSHDCGGGDACGHEHYKTDDKACIRSWQEDPDDPENTWAAFSDAPVSLYDPHYHPARLLWARATSGRASGPRWRPHDHRPRPPYGLGFTPKDVRTCGESGLESSRRTLACLIKQYPLSPSRTDPPPPLRDEPHRAGAVGVPLAAPELRPRLLLAGRQRDLPSRLYQRGVLVPGRPPALHRVGRPPGQGVGVQDGREGLGRALLRGDGPREQRLRGEAAAGRGAQCACVRGIMPSLPFRSTPTLYKHDPSTPRPQVFTCAADGTVRSFDLEAPPAPTVRHEGPVTVTTNVLHPPAVNGRVVGRHRSIVHGFEVRSDYRHVGGSAGRSKTKQQANLCTRTHTSHPSSGRAATRAGAAGPARSSLRSRRACSCGTTSVSPGGTGRR